MIKLKSNADLKDIAKLFLKLGVIGFGGPAAHIAMMQEEVVAKRKWLTEQHFLDLIAATNLIPGPNSTEMAIHIGHEKAGWKGLIVAGFCFILPAVSITGFFAWLYKQYAQLPEVKPFVYGIPPAIIAIILGAVYPLAKRSLKSLELAVIGVFVLICSLLNLNEIFLIFLPSFAFVALLNPLVKKMRDSKLFSALLDAVNIASVATIVSVCVSVCRFWTMLTHHSGMLTHP